MAGQMLKRRSIAKRKVSVADKKKEEDISGLIQKISAAGYVVRREELKRGAGWKASSGMCRVVRDRILFLDRRLPLNEQELFLTEFLRSHSIPSDHGDSTGAGVPEDDEATKGSEGLLLGSPVEANVVVTSETGR